MRHDIPYDRSIHVNIKICNFIKNGQQTLKVMSRGIELCVCRHKIHSVTDDEHTKKSKIGNIMCYTHDVGHIKCTTHTK